MYDFAIKMQKTKCKTRSKHSILFFLIVTAYKNPIYEITICIIH